MNCYHKCYRIMKEVSQTLIYVTGIALSDCGYEKAWNKYLYERRGIFEL